MTKYYPLIIKTALVSLLLHYLFIMYFPLEWLDRIALFENKTQGYYGSGQIQIEAMLVPDLEMTGSMDALAEGTGEGNEGESSDGMGGIDQDKWADLLERLEDNTGFASAFNQTYENLIPNNPVGDSYVYRERYHEDIVVKEVFPTIYDIDKPFEDILDISTEKLSEYVERNEIIEQFRSQNAEDALLTVDLISKTDDGNLGPLVFPPEERQKYFDETLVEDKTRQLADFIEKYFDYDPNEGDLPIATRELYQKNLERLLYSFSTDPTYMYLDFYLENLNKEDFLHNALHHASRLDGSKTSTELLFSLERIYEIQQRAWKTYFEFDSRYQNMPDEQKNRLRIETLRRVSERYAKVLGEKEIRDYGQLEVLYRQRRYEIMQHIIDNTPGGYRRQDALFEQSVIQWEMAVQANDEKKKAQAIQQWKSLIEEAKQKNLSEEDNQDYLNLKHLRGLEAMLRAYELEPSGRREKNIGIFLMKRQGQRLNDKRKREAELLWPN